MREFVEEAFGYAGLDWRDYVERDVQYVRPAEVDILLADAGKAKRELSWEPKVDFHGLVRIMVDADLEEAGLQSIGEGTRILKMRFSDWHQWRSPVPKKGPSFERVGVAIRG